MHACDLESDVRLKPATPAHARDLALLVNLAGEGLPWYLWSQLADVDQSPLEIGCERALRTSGGFSYVNGWIIESNREVQACMMGYPLGQPMSEHDIAAAPEPVQPLLKLEALAPGSWYINVLATFEEFRKQGLGTRLVRHAERQATITGHHKLSLIVAKENQQARTLYLQLGFESEAVMPIIEYRGCPGEGEWELMVKALS